MPKTVLCARVECPSRSAHPGSEHQVRPVGIPRVFRIAPEPERPKGSVLKKSETDALWNHENPLRHASDRRIYTLKDFFSRFPSLNWAGNPDSWPIFDQGEEQIARQEPSSASDNPDPRVVATCWPILLRQPSRKNSAATIEGIAEMDRGEYTEYVGRAG